MEPKYIIILIILLIFLGYIVDEYYFKYNVEKFHTYDDEGYVENKVIELYNELLQRQPSPKEIHNQSLDIVKGQLTLDELRQRIINSDEYQINMKMQSNTIVPEIHKMVSDRALLDRITDIYMQELKLIVPSRMILPLKDLYVYFNYNEGALRALLRDPQYLTFEQEVVTTESLAYIELIAIFKRYYVYDTLIASGNIINNQMVPVSDLSVDYGTAEAMGIKLSHRNYRSIDDRDTNSGIILNQLNQNQDVLDKDLAATALGQNKVVLYDANGNPIDLTKLSAPIVIDARGNPVGTVYDAGGHIIPSTGIVPNMIVYDASGNKIQVTADGLLKDSKGNPIGTIYDKNGNPISQSSITINTEIYDSTGKKLKVIPSSSTDKNGNPLGTVYDVYGNIVPPYMLVAGMTVFDADGNQLTTSANLNELTDGTAAKQQCGKLEYKRVMLPTHQNDMVHIPEMAWTVPNYHPPVCTTLGKEPLIQPVFSATNSQLLLGTPLAVAENTGVGSIMPKFTYKEYIDIPS